MADWYIYNSWACRAGAYNKKGLPGRCGALLSVTPFGRAEAGHGIYFMTSGGSGLCPENPQGTRPLTPHYSLAGEAGKEKNFLSLSRG